MRIYTTKEMLQKAIQRSLEIGTLKGSFMNGDRSIVGCLGELAFQDAYLSAELCNTYDFDFRLKGKTIDVKSRIAKAPINQTFDFTLPCLKKDQEVDFYVFAAVYWNFEYVDLLGYLPYKEFVSLRSRVKKGDPMPQGGYFRSDGFQVFVGDFQALKGK